MKVIEVLTKILLTSHILRSSSTDCLKFNSLYTYKHHNVSWTETGICLYKIPTVRIHIFHPRHYILLSYCVFAPQCGLISSKWTASGISICVWNWLFIPILLLQEIQSPVLCAEQYYSTGSFHQERQEELLKLHNEFKLFHQNKTTLTYASWGKHMQSSLQISSVLQ